MKITLARLPVGIPAIVDNISTDKLLSRRLRDFGLIPGTTVSVCYRSPHGGVTALVCRGTVVAIRTKQLQSIYVRLL